MNSDEREIYESFPYLMSQVDPANLTLENRGGLPFEGVEVGHYYIIKCEGYPKVEPNRVHGQPHVKNKHLGYRYFIVYITDITNYSSTIHYMVEAFKYMPDSPSSRYIKASIFSNTVVNQPYSARWNWSDRVWGEGGPTGFVVEFDAQWQDITSYVSNMPSLLNWVDENPFDIKL
tara:strand:- start:4401 stop:4925 length:525 start_codon:yes stop_codon:yes gene_type:complete